MRYVEVSEIHDTQTGLIWQKVCQGSFTIEEAIAYVESFNASTGKAWRLPTIDELHTLVDRSISNPATEFPDMPTVWFWSSSPYVGYSNDAWGVSFSNGVVSYDVRDNYRAVRLVRDAIP